MERAAAEVLREKANLLRESIRRSEAVHEGAAAALASIANHMAAIDEAVRPAQARTYDTGRLHYNVRTSYRTVGTIVRQLDHVDEAERVILNRPSKDFNAYLDAVDKLRGVEYFFTSKRSCKSGDDALKRVDELLSGAAVKLENEFRSILTKCSKPVEIEYLLNCLPNYPSSSKGQPTPNAECSLPTLMDPRYVPLLSKLVHKSGQLGRHKQILNIYSESRGLFLELTLKHLGVEHVTKEQVQNARAEILSKKIAQWIQSFRIVVKLLFAAERILCDQIFQGKYTWKDRCFAQVTAKSLSTLLSFGEYIAKSQTSPDKVFILLDMYEATFELQSEVEAIFEGSACSENRKSVLNLTKRLAHTAKKNFYDFRENIVKDSPKSTTTDGAVHPLTSYVVNYANFLLDYKSSLEQIFQDSSAADGKKSDVVVSQISGVMHALEINLDVKSKQYKDLALGNLFLMNNIHHIVRSICRSELKDFCGDDWIQRRRRIVQQHATQYRRVAWGKVLECLSAQGLTSSVSSVAGGTQRSVGNIGSYSNTTSRSVIKERFRSFNMQFEGARQKQINWAIPDKELKDNLILSVAEILLPAYRSFLKRFGPLVENSHSASKYMKYTPETLEQALGNLFGKKSPSEQ